MTKTGPDLQGKQQLEWLEVNRNGSFAMGCVDRVPRRKYHSSLTVRSADLEEATNVVCEVGERIQIRNETYLLHNLDFKNDIFPLGFQHLKRFSQENGPTWVYDLNGLEVQRSLRLDASKDIVRITYRFRNVPGRLVLTLEPLLTCRPIHRVSRENPFLNGSVEQNRTTGEVSLEPYVGLPTIRMRVVGPKRQFVAAGRWDRAIHYAFEEERGYEPKDDLYSPGLFHVELESDGVVVFELGTCSLDDAPKAAQATSSNKADDVSRLAAALRQFEAFRGDSASLIAGYPWFGPRLTDAMLAVRGLNVVDHAAALRLLETAANILTEKLITKPLARLSGNLLNGALHFCRAVQDICANDQELKRFTPVVYKLLDAIRSSNFEGVTVTDDGGLHVTAGKEPMTWMNAVVDDQPVCSRHGFVIELNALLYNAAQFALERAKRDGNAVFVTVWKPLMENADAVFMARFWAAELGYFADTFDGSAQDMTLRPNQLWAIGLPFSPVPATQAMRSIEKMRSELLTPLGLRTLAPSDPRYNSHYRGNSFQRDQAYQQGSVWPALIGIYADAAIKLYGIDQARAELAPILTRLLEHLNNEACIGQISELFDGDAPHRAGGAPAHVWSVAEVLRSVARIS